MTLFDQVRSEFRKLPWRLKLLILLAPIGWAGAFLIHRTLPNESLHFAIRENNAIRVHELLDRSPELLETRNRSNFTPLLLAVQEDQIEILKLLIRRGANVNAADSLHWNGLHLAANDNLLEVTRILLEAGTSPYTKNSLGQTPLDIARMNRNWNIVNLIERKGEAISFNRPTNEPLLKLHPNQILPPSP